MSGLLKYGWVGVFLAFPAWGESLGVDEWVAPPTLVEEVEARPPVSGEALAIREPLAALLMDLGETHTTDSSLDALAGEVARHVVRFKGVSRGGFQRALARGWKYQPMLRAAFREYGLPGELAWLSLVESSFHFRARSSAGAVGLWQLMPDTARIHGMSVEKGRDERQDPVRATLAAREYLRDRLASFGEGQVLLSIAAYNAGEGRVREVMGRTGADEFMALKAALPTETQNYVPLFLAAALIGRAPRAHGFLLNESADMVVQVRQRKNLRELARELALPMQTLRAFNDDVPTGAEATPVSNFFLRVPGDARASEGDVIWRHGVDQDANHVAWRQAIHLPEFDMQTPVRAQVPVRKVTEKRPSSAETRSRAKKTGKSLAAVRLKGKPGEKNKPARVASRGAKGKAVVMAKSHDNKRKSSGVKLVKAAGKKRVRS